MMFRSFSTKKAITAIAATEIATCNCVVRHSAACTASAARRSAFRLASSSARTSASISTESFSRFSMNLCSAWRHSNQPSS